ncbi:Murein DD-endopeptidase MepM/ murein hydrolase activator NlpD OS=Castellaniella defragrans OX=75697 GN=HNR28_003445 PE=4 SV=1 [Castellaniella defragrans]
MMPDAQQTRPHSHVTRSLLFAAGGLFLTAAALAVVKPSAPPEPVFQARQTLDLSPLGATTKAPLSQAPFIASTRIRRGDTVSDLLDRLGVNENGLLAFLTHDSSARSIYKLYPGRLIQAALDDQNNLVWLRYSHTPGTSVKAGVNSAWLEVRPDGKGGYTARERTVPAEQELRVAEGEIDSSLFGAADEAHIPDSITLEMVDILGSRIDFLKDLRKGDRFRILYDAYMHNGEEVGTGRIRALEFINGGKTYSAVWFDDPHGSSGYYDFSGASLKGAFLKTAIKFTRISSRFGMRMHPIHKKWVGHKGVDYAAPTGTPIHATSDGTVAFIGRQTGYGNVIILKNFGEYSTVYAHQSRFASGLHKGDHVQQGQVIGFVGQTGWATGPHLHYEFRIDGKPVDPLSVDLPVARTLEPADQKAFHALVARYQPDIQMLAALQDSRIQVAER